MIFILAGLTGPPTAAAPGAMLLNAVVLAAAARLLLVAATGLVLRLGPPQRSAVLGLLALLIGTGGWMINLVGRWAVALSGASDLQARVEGRAWLANVYLRGLTGEPDFLSYLLVWMDLVQVVYVALGYLGFGLVVRAALRVGLLQPRPGRVIGAVAFGLAALLVVSAVVAAWVGPVGLVAAWTAFVLSIPFMSTLVPYLLGAAILTARVDGSAGQPLRRGDQEHLSG